VLTVFTLENMLLGLVSAALALLLSQVGSWIIITFAFELTYQPFIGASLLLVILAMLLVTTVGLLASVSILRQKPILFLRQQTGE
jgi:putative ABC transport system permease protein